MNAPDRGVPRAPNTAADDSSAGPRRRWLGWLVVVVGILIAVPADTYRARIEIAHPYVILENSLRYGMPYRLGQGDLVGRDMVFSYGPLFQVVTGLGLLLPHGDLASIMRWHELPKVALTMCAVWGALGMVRTPFGARVGLYLIWAALYAAPFGEQMTSIKPLAAMWVCMAAAWLLCPSPRRTVLPAAVFWAVTPPVMMAYSFDLGPLLLVAFTGIAVLTTLVAPSLWRRGLLCVTATWGTSLLAAAALRFIPGWEGYLSEGWHFTQGYAVTGGLPLATNALVILIVVGLACLTVLMLFALRAWTAFRAAAPDARAALAMIGGTCFCLLWLRYGLSRSDPFHIARALASAIFLIGALVPGYLMFVRRAAAAQLALPLLLVLLAAANPRVVPALQERLSAWPQASASPPTLDITHPVLNEAVDAARQLSAETLYVWPFETIIAAAAGKRSPDYTLQSYAAFTQRLERETIDRLEAEPELAALLYRAAGDLDGVVNMTRTSVIFRHLLEEFELEQPPTPALIVLQRAAAKRPWEERVLVEQGELPELVPTAGEALAIELPAGAARVSDLLLIRLRLAAQSMYMVGKHGMVVVQLELDDGTTVERRIPVPQDGSTNEYLVTAAHLRDPLFPAHFNSAPRGWKSSESVRRILVSWQGGDFMARHPLGMTVESAAVLERQDIETVETPYAKQDDPAVFEWLFQDGSRP